MVLMNKCICSLGPCLWASLNVSIPTEPWIPPIAFPSHTVLHTVCVESCVLAWFRSPTCHQRQWVARRPATSMRPRTNSVCQQCLSGHDCSLSARVWPKDLSEAVQNSAADHTLHQRAPGCRLHAHYFTVNLSIHGAAEFSHTLDFEEMYTCYCWNSVKSSMSLLLCNSH